jgi:hypothetical protein
MDLGRCHLVNQRGGSGGYGAIWTLNQEQRAGRYEPHITISRQFNYATNMWEVKCLDCGVKWEHSQNDRVRPEECTKPRPLSEDVEEVFPKLVVEIEDD